MMISLLAAGAFRQGDRLDSLQILSVSYEEDSMCFMTIQKDSGPESILSNSLDFTIPFPSALKLHSSAYALLEKMAEASSSATDESTNLALSITFQPDYFRLLADMPFHYDAMEITSAALSPAVTTHFNQLLAKISSYASTPFERFFWTSQSTKAYLTDLLDRNKYGSEIEIDIERGAFWSMAADKFQTSIAREATWNHNDICGFEIISDAKRFHPVRLYSYRIRFNVYKFFFAY